jgi:hypothetical protein
MHGNLGKVKITNGKLDQHSLEEQIKKKMPGYTDFSFDHTSNFPRNGRTFVTARKPDTPGGMVEVFVFVYEW